MFFKGVSFGFLAKNGYYSSPTGELEIQKICDAGVNSVALMATVMQDGYSSTRMYSDFHYTPSDCELADTVEKFHRAGIKVMLKPIIECHDSAWRGWINFPDRHQQIQGIITDYWGEWFRNYTECMKHYARFADRQNVEVLCIGCEMQGAEPQEQHWEQMIQELRKIYKGLITYNTSQLPPGCEALYKWYSHLDILGISYYTGSPRINPSAKEIEEDMKPHADTLDKLMKEFPRPVFFAECGARSVAGGAKAPCEYQLNGDYDGTFQANYLSAVTNLFSKYKWWHGLLWWKWDEQQNRPQYKRDGGDTGFTIYGKPALDVLKKWCRE